MPSSASDLEITPLVPGEAIGAFTCGDGALDDFLTTDAHRLQQNHAVKTYLARRVETGAEVLGFVSLMTDPLCLGSEFVHRPCIKRKPRSSRTRVFLEREKGFVVERSEPRAPQGAPPSTEG